MNFLRKIKKNQSIVSVATEASSGTPVYACAPAAVTELVVCKNDTTNTAMECYCDTAMCNDITKCDCHTGDNYTPYANKVKNTDWANAENGAPREVIATAFATVLSAVGAFWLL